MAIGTRQYAHISKCHKWNTEEWKVEIGIQISMSIFNFHNPIFNNRQSICSAIENRNTDNRPGRENPCLPWTNSWRKNNCHRQTFLLLWRRALLLGLWRSDWSTPFFLVMWSSSNVCRISLPKFYIAFRPFF